MADDVLDSTKEGPARRATAASTCSESPTDFHGATGWKNEALRTQSQNPDVNAPSTQAL